jgi:hypothetical protein
MSEQKHIVKRQVIELTVSDAAQAGRLHDQISRICRQRITPLIDQYCSELSAPDRLYRIERLELDIGAIDERRLEAELVARVGAALRPALAAQIAEQEREAHPDRRPETLAQLELLALFARRGSLPWWADAAEPEMIEHAVRELLERAPQQLRRLVRELAHEQPGALRRLAAHLPDDTLALLSASLVPTVQNALAHDLPVLSELLQATQAGAGRAADQLRRSTWAAILHVAGAAGQQHTAMRPFYQALLRRLAAELGVAYTALLAELRRAVQPDRARETLLGALEHERDSAAPAPSLAPSSGADAPFAELLVALNELERGTPTRETVQRILRLLQLAPVAQALPPVELRDLEHRLRAALHPEPAAALADQKLPPVELRDLEHRLRAALHPEPAAALAPLDLRFSDADELYVGNAGLVILWPFLGDFFARLGLLDGRRFKDHAAQERAAGLLQHVATGDKAFPEYLLPLNKLLCGLHPAELFDFGEPLLDAEAAACAELLAAAIAEAPILRDMSADGFRGTFLLRQGVLSARDGAWLLRVERRTYDIVLDRFPWSWEVLRSPWMDAPLRVEW